MDNDPTNQSSLGTTIWTDQINSMCETCTSANCRKHYANCIRHSMGVRNYHNDLPISPPRFGRLQVWKDKKKSIRCVSITSGATILALWVRIVCGRCCPGGAHLLKNLNRWNIHLQHFNIYIHLSLNLTLTVTVGNTTEHHLTLPLYICRWWRTNPPTWRER